MIDEWDEFREQEHSRALFEISRLQWIDSHHTKLIDEYETKIRKLEGKLQKKCLPQVKTKDLLDEATKRGFIVTKGDD